MPIDFDAADRERDRKLRHSLLEVFYLSRGSAPMLGISGRRAVNLVNQSSVSDERFVDDIHAMSMLLDLELKGLVALTRGQRLRGAGPGPDNVFVKITDAGCRLYRGEAPADPDVWDHRATGGEI